MSWIRALALTDLPVGQAQAIDLHDEEILLCRVSETEVYAVENLCSHDDGPLAGGTLTGAAIECPRHGARFDVTTGAVTRLPAAAALQTYATRLKDGWVEVAPANSSHGRQESGEEDA